MHFLLILIVAVASTVAGFGARALTEDRSATVETRFVEPVSPEVSTASPSDRFTLRVGGLMRANHFEPSADGPIDSAAELHAVLLAADWPRDSLSDAVRVAGCESSWDPQAIGQAGEVGLFQIHGVHAGRVPAGGDLKDPVTNARVALDIWMQEGWNPWSCRSALE